MKSKCDGIATVVNQFSKGWLLPFGTGWFVFLIGLCLLSVINTKDGHMDGLVGFLYFGMLICLGWLMWRISKRATSLIVRVLFMGFNICLALFLSFFFMLSLIKVWK